MKLTGYVIMKKISILLICILLFSTTLSFGGAYEKWEKRAVELHEQALLTKGQYGNPNYIDCDSGLFILIKEMNKEGIRAGKDYVAQRVRVGKLKHIRLIMKDGTILDVGTGNKRIKNERIDYTGTFDKD